ncbi:DUF5518 domain-containing protein [Natronococcus sp. A-GB7]|uniref:DUF5518 domain-containing protein n=1 Tax=Natronococcus sp. A-GB7 TaxID=3037649 RepID=UPI00241E9D01|nr:DUF5518 domain-containing protein [Natronococcus sp. A-GB7]MDG5817944.1 DUF5518 domain-containing protein [Natronococcus sp. A-GB7]
MVSGRTIINAIIGAVVGIVLSFIPFSTVVGGAVAGFLEGPDDRDGAIVGALAGAITFVPIAAVAVLGIGFVGFGFGVAAAPAEGFAFVVLLILVGVLFAFVYTVGLSLLGGYLGAYLAREYPGKHARTRETFGGRRREPTPRSGTRPRERDAEGTDRHDSDRSTRNEPADEREDGDLDPSRWHETRDRERDE